MPPYPSGSVRLENTEDGTVLHLNGDIDNAAVDTYEDALAEPSNASADLLIAVEAADVTFLNSAGVAFLVRQLAAARAAGHKPELRRPSRVARRVLQITGVISLFRVVP